MITLLPPFRANSMQGLATKVTKGVYDQISSRYSADLQQMVKSCLQVNCEKRPSCDQILATPGLLNHLTGTLEELVYEEECELQGDNLLQTIRCPRNLGQITERLPKAQYQHRSLKRSASMAIEATSDLKKLDMKNVNAISPAEPKRVQDL
jgi:serine/threonine protein kinase